ncbi:MAG: hypothetical protein Q7T89_07830, partial [Anaerolineales bacterium]|nr:hypothetical protein [Anaerolineales bacterium]
MPQTGSCTVVAIGVLLLFDLSILLTVIFNESHNAQNHIGIFAYLIFRIKEIKLLERLDFE